MLTLLACIGILAALAVVNLIVVRFHVRRQDAADRRDMAHWRARLPLPPARDPSYHRPTRRGGR